MDRWFGGLWRHADFRTLWIGQTVSVFGSQITMLAVPLLAALTLEASAWEMGVLVAAGRLPLLLFGLVAGVWVDRLRRRPLMIATNLGRALLLGVIPLAALLGALRIEHLYVVTFLAGVLALLFDVANQAYLPAIIPRHQLVDGNGKLELSRSVAQVAGPGLGGALVQFITAPLAILLDALSFVASAVCLGLIRAPEPAARPRHERAPVLVEIRDGLRAVGANPALRAIAGATATLELFWSVMYAVFVIFATRDLGLSPALLGVVMALGGLGAPLGALAADRLARRWGIGLTIVAGYLCVSLGTLLVPLSGGVALAAVPLLVAAWVLIEFGDLIYDVNEISLRQAITPDHLLGRVNGTMRFLTWGTIPIGSLLGGALGEWLGVQPTLLIGALGTLLALPWIVASPVWSLREAPGDGMVSGQGSVASGQ